MRQERGTVGTAGDVASEPSLSRPAPRGLLWSWVALAFVGATGVALALYLWLFPEPRRRLAGAMVQWVGLLESGPGTNAVSLSGRIRVTAAAGRWQPWQDASLSFHLQPPDHLRLEWERAQGRWIWIRRGEQIEVYVPTQNWGLRGKVESDGVAGAVGLSPFRSPVAPGKVWMAVLTLEIRALGEVEAGGDGVWAVGVRARPRVVQAGVLPAGEVRFWLRTADGLPVRMEFRNADGLRVLAVECEQWQVQRSAPAEVWQPHWPQQPRIEDVPLRFLARYWSRWWEGGEASEGLRPRVHGAGLDPGSDGRSRLEWHEDVPVLWLAGSTGQRARQQAERLSAVWQRSLQAFAYAWPVHRSLEEGRWILGAHRPEAWFTRSGSDRPWEGAMSQLAESAGISPADVWLAHVVGSCMTGRTWAVGGPGTEARPWACLGYAAYGEREFPETAWPLVVVHRPDRGYAWVGFTRAGLWGASAGMNSRQLALAVEAQVGEGEPPALPGFVQAAEILETSDTLERALERLQQSAGQGRATWLLAEGRTGRMVQVEVGPDQFKVQALPVQRSSPDGWAVAAGPGARSEALGPPVGLSDWPGPLHSGEAEGWFGQWFGGTGGGWNVALDPAEWACWLYVHSTGGGRPTGKLRHWDLRAWLGEDSGP